MIVNGAQYRSVPDQNGSPATNLMRVGRTGPLQLLKVALP
jgi:hypothetical protein